MGGADRETPAGPAHWGDLSYLQQPAYAATVKAAVEGAPRKDIAEIRGMAGWGQGDWVVPYTRENYVEGLKDTLHLQSPQPRGGWKGVIQLHPAPGVRVFLCDRRQCEWLSAQERIQKAATFKVTPPARPHATGTQPPPVPWPLAVAPPLAHS